LQGHIVFGHDADHDGLDNNTNVNIIYTKTDGIAKQTEATLTGQKYFRTKIFPYIFHIKPFIFKTFS